MVMAMKKVIALIGTIATIGLGAVVLNPVVPASASPATPQAAEQTAGACGTHASLKDVLDKLVADGTISQDQETKILDAIKAAHQANKADNQAQGPRDRLRFKAIKDAAQVAAGKIGVSVDELKTAVKGGQSVADVANTHGVNPADVEKAIVDAATAKVDAAVTAGTLTPQQGGFLKARLPEMAFNFVNHAGEPKAEGCGPQAGGDSSGSTNSSSSSSSTGSGSSDG